MTSRSLTGRFLAALAAFTFVLAPVHAEAPLPADARIAPDPAVRMGRLPNGLRYAVMENRTPAKMISIRLAIEVGSYEEEDKERGFAHYIEHLAFRSTKLAPDGGFDDRFAALGIAIGKDQNAFTGLRETLYRVDLPAGGTPAAKKLLEWMRSAADGILITPAAVQSELGVVLAEMQARESPMARIARETALFQAPHLRSSDRDVGGTEASLKAATPAALQAFYDRWYRPQNAFVVVVGDAPAAELQQAVEEAFGSWAPRGPAGIRPAPPTAAQQRGLEAMSRSDPGLPSQINACRVGLPDTDRTPTLGRLRRDIYSQIWTTIIDKRLRQLAATEDSVVLAADVGVSREAPDLLSACLAVAPTNGRWKEALAAAQGELRRFAEQGPTPLEVETVAEELRSRLRAAQTTGGTRNSSAVADQLASAELNDLVFQDPNSAMETYNLVVDGLTPEDIRKAFAADWSGAGPFLVATAEHAPAREELVAAWRANEAAAPLPAYADRKDSVWAYRGFGKPGKVKSRRDFENPAFTRFTFDNGVVLSFKRTSYQAEGAEIRIRFGWGERALTPATRVSTALAAGLFPMGGLGRMDFEQIGSALQNTTWAFTMSVDPDAYTLSSSTLANQVPQQMQLLAAYMTDPGFRSMMDDKLPTTIDYMYRAYRTQPNMVAVEALESAVFPDKPSLPPREIMAAYNVDDFEKLLRPVLTGAPIEVTIVGDMPEGYAVNAVAQTFGALPKRKPLSPPRGEGPFRRFPSSLPGPIKAKHEGPPEKAAAILMWPLWVATPERRSEEYAVLLLAQIYETRLLREIRVGMGKVYSPTVAAVTPDDSDEGYLAVSLDSAPADIDLLTDAARRIARELAAGTISQAELDAARDPMIAARLQAQNRNEAWAGILAASLRHPEAMDELLAYERQLRELSLEDVRKAAAKWVARDPLVSTAYPAAAAGTR
ncbi:MAG TPA: insulinase family protein [Allosphingosinicella sp.]